MQDKISKAIEEN